MKKILSICMLLLLVIGMSACQGEEEKSMSQNKSQNQEGIKGEKILIAYFTFPETDGTDTSSSASRIVDNGELKGATEYVAKVIKEQTNGELFQIETKQTYPGTHEPLVAQASEEQSKNARPELKREVDNLSEYDIVFIGYPNWWGDMPMPLYTFLENSDLAGKTIIPFNTHGGSSFSSTIDEIKRLQPKATVVEDGLTISRDNVANSESEIIQWVNGLGIESNK